MAKFMLRFSAHRIPELAAAYSYADPTHIESVIRPTVRRDGFYTRSQFLDISHWKSPRTRPRCEQNDEDFVQAVTHTALSHPHERVRIELLTLLRGVSWLSASVLLHFGHRAPYQILDFRALWSLKLAPPAVYTFEFW